MIKHIVVWRLKEHAHGNTKMQNAEIMKNLLEALPTKVPGILKLEVGIDFSKTDSSGDIALVTEFASKKDLDNYQIHPEHRAIMPFVAEAKSERFVIDYEI